ncbi:MAG: HAD hydrolase-like protein, partial [Gemmatimonadaceae bacterium]|nr:HAD hydrolase-like protein [Gemmatimonadaceae bacterium]
NSTAKSATTLLEHAGIRDLFDHVLSVDAIERYKPAREAYEYAAKELRVNLGDFVLVAAHAWDIAGAMAAGAATAFVTGAGRSAPSTARTPRSATQRGRSSPAGSRGRRSADCSTLSASPRRQREG